MRPIEADDDRRTKITGCGAERQGRGFDINRVAGLGAIESEIKMVEGIAV